MTPFDECHYALLPLLFLDELGKVLKCADFRLNALEYTRNLATF